MVWIHTALAKYLTKKCNHKPGLSGARALSVKQKYTLKPQFVHNKQLKKLHFSFKLTWSNLDTKPLWEANMAGSSSLYQKVVNSSSRSGFHAERICLLLQQLQILLTDRSTVWAWGLLYCLWEGREEKLCLKNQLFFFFFLWHILGFFISLPSTNTAEFCKFNNKVT